jgi:hypothetical protein
MTPILKVHSTSKCSHPKDQAFAYGLLGNTYGNHRRKVQKKNSLSAEQEKQFKHVFMIFTSNYNLLPKKKIMYAWTFFIPIFSSF